MTYFLLTVSAVLLLLLALWWRFKRGRAKPYPSTAPPRALTASPGVYDWAAPPTDWDIPAAAARPNPYAWPVPFDLAHALTTLDRIGVETEHVASTLGVTIDEIVDWVSEAEQPSADKLAVYEPKLAQLFVDAKAWQDFQPPGVGLVTYLQQRESERRTSCSSTCGNVA